jgi:hypothetical protein
MLYLIWEPSSCRSLGVVLFVLSVLLFRVVVSILGTLHRSRGIEGGKSGSGAFDRGAGRECIWCMFCFYSDGRVFIMRSNMGLCMYICRGFIHL